MAISAAGFHRGFRPNTAASVLFSLCTNSGRKSHGSAEMTQFDDVKPCSHLLTKDCISDDHACEFHPRRPSASARPEALLKKIPRRKSRIMRALGSPKMPRMVVAGEKPGKRYVSWSLRCDRIGRSCHVFARFRYHKTRFQQDFYEKISCFLTHYLWRRALLFCLGFCRCLSPLPDLSHFDAQRFFLSSRH